MPKFRSFQAVLYALLLAAAFTPPAQAQLETRLLPGAGSRSPVEIEAERLDYFDKEQKLVYQENVFAKQDDSTLKASVLTIFLNGSPGKTGELPTASGGGNDVRRMEAEGPVTITSKDQVGQGDRAVYDKADNKLFLIGNVSLNQRGNVIKGRPESRLVYDLTSGHAQIVGGITSQVTPASGASGARKPPEAKPPEMKPPEMKPPEMKPPESKPADAKPAPRPRN